jgi:hypothetical protein
VKVETENERPIRPLLSTGTVLLIIADPKTESAAPTRENAETVERQFAQHPNPRTKQEHNSKENPKHICRNIIFLNCLETRESNAPHLSIQFRRAPKSKQKTQQCDRSSD